MCCSSSIPLGIDSDINAKLRQNPWAPKNTKHTSSFTVYAWYPVHDYSPAATAPKNKSLIYSFLTHHAKADTLESVMVVIGIAYRKMKLARAVEKRPVMAKRREGDIPVAVPLFLGSGLLCRCQ